MMDEVQTMGFSFESRPPGETGPMHRHREIEINLVRRGSMTYLFRGERVEVVPGRLTVFWAAMPHQVVSVEPDTFFHCAHLPLATFLRWQLPGRFNQALLGGEIALEPDADRAGEDLACFARWNEDLRSPSPETRRIVLLEMEARLCRLALAVGRRTAAPVRPASSSGETDKVERMAALVAERCREPLTVHEIATHVGLHPKYAMTLFRRQCGVTLGDYLTQQRLAQAQRLLATTDAKIVDIAFESGFGSVSRFYEVFERFCGQSPRSYRFSVQRRE